MLSRNLICMDARDSSDSVGELRLAMLLLKARFSRLFVQRIYTFLVKQKLNQKRINKYVFWVGANFNKKE